MPKSPAINSNEVVIDFDGRFYETETGEKYPSVTTVLDLVRIKGFLDKWEQDMIDEVGVEGYKKFMEKKAHQGTYMHALIEEYLRRVKAKEPEPLDIKSANVPFVSWKKFVQWTDWYHEEKPLSFEWTEARLFSHQHKYAGTADALTKLQDGFYIHDWKSSKQVTDKHLMQLAAYIKAYEEMSGDQLEGGIVVATGCATKKGYKAVKISNHVEHKNGNGESEVDYYFNWFMDVKRLVDRELVGMADKERSAPRYIFPISYAS